MLELRGIHKIYTTGDFTQAALKDVNLRFSDQAFVSILGPSGSGKTTLLNIIGGLDRYDEGDLLLDGQSTRHFRTKDWDAYRNNSVGFVFQSYHLIPHLSVLDNVALGMTLSGEGKQARTERATEVLTAVGLKDHLHKRPAELSGGQAQRVAIARALANDPEILLADEPTGALDTETSRQILDLLKEISRDRLVIMVTHNRQLAEHYSDRIIELLDGKIVKDEAAERAVPEEADEPFSLRHTAMGFLTALALSGRNILTKKGRTFLTAFASSIGIIGIGLILSLSHGFRLQIDRFEQDAMANFPVRIERVGMSLDQMLQMERPDETMEAYPDDATLRVRASVMDRMMHRNRFSGDFLAYIEKVDPALISGITVNREADMHLLRDDGGTYTKVTAADLRLQSWPRTQDDEQSAYFRGLYDVVAGRLPETPYEVLLLVDEYQSMLEARAEALGLQATDGETVDMDDVTGRSFALVPNDAYFVEETHPETGQPFFREIRSEDELQTAASAEETMTLTVVGVLRPKEDAGVSNLMPGILYSDDLMTEWIDVNETSRIVEVQRDVPYHVLTGQPFPETSTDGPEGAGGETIGDDAIGEEVPDGTVTRDDVELSGDDLPVEDGGGQTFSMMARGVPTKDDVLRRLGGDTYPASIDLYPKSFEAKSELLAYLDAWNEGKADEDTIVYLDQAAIITTLSRGIMDGITVALVAFAAISLVVSLIMIGIITYISVLERTKEIGILRALGARRKDISRVFNAETFIIGLLSGVLGLAIVRLLLIPANHLLYELTELKQVAQLNPVHALGLLILSVGLTVLGGVIPARMAAKKDPVAALRAD